MGHGAGLPGETTRHPSGLEIRLAQNHRLYIAHGAYICTCCRIAYMVYGNIYIAPTSIDSSAESHL